jgi:putative endonuclease
MSTKDTGNRGEQLACEYLVNKGYKIVGRNCRMSFGEIDIIAKKRGLFAAKTIHFVEVKTSENTANFFPEDRVNYRKQNKYKRLVEIWLEKNKFSQNYPCQVDIIAVLLNADNPKIEYFENVISN